MIHILPELPFDPGQMTPFCSKETFEYHHGKHHAAYIAKLNDAIKGTPFEEMSLEDVIKASDRDGNKAVFNNAAQHFNHSFFWSCLSTLKSDPSPKLIELLERDFGSLDKFKEQFANAAATLFGSGWVWLVQNPEGKLEIVQLKDAGTPITSGQKPLLALDVWEHAYYIDFRNRRPDYIKEFENFVNWSEVGNRLS